MKLNDINLRPDGSPDDYDPEVLVEELEKCSGYDVESLLYFIINYAMIYSNDDRGWIPFKLWDTDCSPYDNQFDLIEKIFDNTFVIVLKARQVGMTWICLMIGLWLMLFHPEQSLLLLSKDEEAAKHLLKRLKGIYYKLPKWMHVSSMPTNNLEEWEFSNGSSAKSVSTKGGDSFTFTMAIVDEADLIHRANTPLSQVMLNIEPTVGLEGKLVLISKSDKSRPNSTFKKIFKAARKGLNRFVWGFMPWNVNPKRTNEWYKHQQQISMDIDQTYDTVHESYPETPEEALSPKSGNKRLPYTIVQHIYEDRKPLLIYNDSMDMPDEYDGPDIHNLYIYEYPIKNKSYGMGVDSAEGLATGDNAGIVIINEDSMQVVARYKGRIDPSILAGYANRLSLYYNDANILFERNNHGIAFKKEMNDNYPDRKLLQGWTADGKSKKQGWFTSAASKTLAYDTAAAFIRKHSKQNRESEDDNDLTILIPDEEIYSQLTSVETNTLKAPEGEEDDLAVSYVLSLMAVLICGVQKIQFSMIPIR